MRVTISLYDVNIFFSKRQKGSGLNFSTSILCKYSLHEILGMVPEQTKQPFLRMGFKIKPPHSLKSCSEYQPYLFFFL